MKGKYIFIYITDYLHYSVSRTGMNTSINKLMAIRWRKAMPITKKELLKSCNENYGNATVIFTRWTLQMTGVCYSDNRNLSTRKDTFILVSASNGPELTIGTLHEKCWKKENGNRLSLFQWE